jgi:tetratricopeptide (TPR) repeat protein
MISSYIVAFERVITMLTELLGSCKEMMASGKRTEAMAFLKEMIHMLPLRADLHAHLGKRFLGLKMYDKAFRMLFLAHVENPTDIDTCYDYACACFHRGDLALARVLCQEILRYGPETSPIQARAKRLMAVLKEQGAGA